jgi:5-methyltetrahydropteroyltriglutamate--homocysteine methyltransferase
VSVETAQSGLDCEILTQLDGKTIILGVLNLGDETVENPAEIVARVRRALAYVPAERLVLAPDCGMKYLPREAAFGKLVSLRMAAALLRADAGVPTVS